MINDNTILSSFDDRPTLLEWLKKVEDALKTDTATAVSVENPSANTYVFKITFADGKTLSSGNVVFPDSVKDVSIKNGHIIVTQISGTQNDLGVLNPYAGTIVENAETNTTEIGNNAQVGGDLSVQGSVVGRGIVTSIGRLTANNGIEVHGQGYINGDLGVTGNATIGGRLQVDSSIISNGEIRGGNISGSKFLLGTEEMPLVKANPTGEATETLEKVKIGDVAYNVGSSKNDRELTLILPYSSTAQPSFSNRYTIIDDENVWNNLKNYYYETIKIYYNDGKPFGIFNVLDYYDFQGNFQKRYMINVPKYRSSEYSQWYGKQNAFYYSIQLSFSTNSGVNKVSFTDSESLLYYSLDKSKFDALYKLADKPTQDGNYILKASVSGGAVTYTWELQQ